MGQRHQAFAIRRTRKGAVYTVVCIHHQCLYGRGPLFRTAAFCKALAASKTEAAAAIEAFEATATDYDLDDTSYSKVPFINKLFLSIFDANSTYALSDPHYGNNNDGVTIIDISNLESPRYCFVNIGHLEGQFGSSVPVNLPLSGEMYVRSYYPQAEFISKPDLANEETVVRAISRLANYEVLSIGDLKEAWPHAEWKIGKKDKSAFGKWLDKEAKSLATRHRAVKNQSKKESTAAAKNVTPSTLLNASILALMKSDGANVEGSAHKLDIMLGLDHIRDAIWKNARAGNTTMSDFVFKRMLSDASLKELDLQGVSIASNDVLVEATAGCPSIQTLNLSGHTEITNDTITSIGSTCRLLQKLLLFGCNNLTADCLQPLNQACPLLHYIYADEIFNANSQKTWSQRSWSVLLVPDYSNGDNWDKRAALQGTWLHGAPLARLLIQWVKDLQGGVISILGGDPLSSMYIGAGSEISGVTYPRPSIAKTSQYGFHLYSKRPVALNQPVCLVIGHPPYTYKPEDINKAIFKYAFLVRTNTNDANPEERVSISGSNFKVCNADEFVMDGRLLSEE
ncbi:UNVERIFIED_CONTAM: hypothetical protein HDU68_009544 [Siphonaria sp. JEL0065]|nr:hypothetical protein HDU68_009544 [Siphonaria sp. JEL0065]